MNRSSNKIVAYVVVLLIAVSAMCVPVSAYYNDKVYVVYDKVYEFGSEVPVPATIVEFLGHFSPSCQMVSIDEWKQGMLADAGMVVYVGLDPSTVLPDGLIREIAAAAKVVWFKYGIERLASTLRWNDFVVLGHNRESTQVKYKDLSFYAWVDAYLAQPGSNGRVMGTVRQGADQIPLLWQRDNVYYVGSFQAYGEFSWILARVFHEIIGDVHTDDRGKSLFKIQDISPLSEVDVVQKLIKVVEEQNIPFAIAITPFGINGNSTYSLYENKALVNVLQEAQKKGASIVLRGYTYQNEYVFSDESGWHTQNSKIRERDEAFIRERIATGVEELLRCDLVPVAFEMPYYAAGQMPYKIAAEFFNIYSGQVQMADRIDAVTLSLPYSTHSKQLPQMMVIPENIGFYGGSKESVEAMLDKTGSMSGVPGVTVTNTYHWYMPVEGVEPLVKGLRQQGYLFLDLRRLPIAVQIPGVRIVERDGDVEIFIVPRLVEKWQELPVSTESAIGNILWWQAVLLVVIAGVFIGIIVKLKIDSRKLYES